MARPTIRRNVRVFPGNRRFVPSEKKRVHSQYNLFFDELEAMRLADIEHMTQEEISQMMRVSRQTVQLILERGREKVTRALVESVVIEIGGGSYSIHHCPFKCFDCQHEFPVSARELAVCCPSCGSVNIDCISEEVCVDHCKREKIR